MKLLNDPVLPIAVPLAALITAGGLLTFHVRQPSARAAQSASVGVFAAPAEVLEILQGKRKFAQEDIPLVVRVMHRAGYDNFLVSIDPSSGDVTVNTGKDVTPHLDIKPGSCPNPLQVGPGGGVATTVATGVLGNAFDVTQTDLGSVRLSRNVPVSFMTTAEVTPVHITFADVGTPFNATQPCDCAALGPDGILDLNVQYNKRDLVDTLGLASDPEGASVPLQVTGLMTGGESIFSAVDCVRIQHR
jgi:hypothetical protein